MLSILLSVIMLITSCTQNKEDTSGETISSFEFSLITCYYRFTQQALFDGKPVTLSDVVVLHADARHSRFYNQSSWYRDSIVNAKIDSLGAVYMHFLDDTRTNSLHNAIRFEQHYNIDMSVIYKDRKGHIISSVNGRYVYKENIQPQEWILLPDTMTILGLKSQKATTFFRGRKYIAWYAKDIPFDAGPWKLYGLPGLILRLEDSEQLFVFEAIRLYMDKDADNIRITKDESVCRHPARSLRMLELDRRFVLQFVFSNNTLFIGRHPNRLEFLDMEID